MINSDTLSLNRNSKLTVKNKNINVSIEISERRGERTAEKMLVGNWKKNRKLGNIQQIFVICQYFVSERFDLKSLNLSENSLLMQTFESNFSSLKLQLFVTITIQFLRFRIKKKNENF